MIKQMTPAGWIGIGATGILTAWLLFVALPKRYGPKSEVVAQPQAERAQPAPATPGRKIKTTLFYISDDGLRLIGVEREVPFAEATTEQARWIIEEQLKAPPGRYLSAIPSGSTLRALYISPTAEAFVDLTGPIARAHPGGSLDELFTVYSIVNALTANLPAVTAVQILIDGKEVETLAGHVDLRHPLRKSLTWTGS